MSETMRCLLSLQSSRWQWHQDQQREELTRTSVLLLLSSRSQSAAATPSSGGAPRLSSSSQAPTTPVTPAASAVSSSRLVPTPPGTLPPAEGRVRMAESPQNQKTSVSYHRFHHFLFQMEPQPRWSRPHWEAPPPISPSSSATFRTSSPP